MTDREFEQDMYESQVAAAAEKRLEEFLNDDRAIAQHLAKRNAYLVQRVEEVETERDMIAEDLTRLTDSEGNYETKDAAIKGVTIEQWREQAAIEQLSREKRATLGVMR